MQILSGATDTSSLVRKTTAGPAVDAVESKATPAPETAEPTDSVAAEGSEQLGRLSGDSGQRVGHFVRSMTHESLQHVRYLAGAQAFRNVGSTLGSLAFTPLAIKLAADNAAVVGGVAIGGTVAMGAIGGLLGYLWVRGADDGVDPEQKKTLFGKVVDGGLDIASAAKALPNFIYPSVYGATDAQRETIYAALDKLPLQDATASATMTVIPGLTDTGISGMAQPGASHVRVLLDQGYIDNPARAEGLIFHENGHAVDYSGGFGLLGSHNWRGGFGKGPFISDYASGNRYEDWAEMYEAYHTGACGCGPTGCACSGFGNKLEVIERVSAGDPLHRMADQPKIREAGKEIGEKLSKVPYLRDGLELAASLVAPVQIYRGTGDLLKGLETNDGELKLRGKFHLATGLFLTLPGASPLALASSVAGGVIKTVANGEKDGFESANKWADGILATSAGPVGMALAAVSGELKANGLEFDDSNGFNSLGWTKARAAKSSLVKGTLFTVGGAVGGSVAGAALGVALGGHGGAALGSLWGQMAGGVVGLGVYGASRALKEGKVGQNPLALTKGDKKFLAGLAGGAILGGVTGTAVGTLGGKAFGQFVGQVVAGPTGAAVGETVFGWAGGLAGALGGAKLGAGVGSGRLLGKPLGSEQAPVSTLADPDLLQQAIKDVQAANVSPESSSAS